MDRKELEIALLALLGREPFHHELLEFSAGADDRVSEEEFVRGSRKLVERDDSFEGAAATLFKALDAQGLGFLTLETVRTVFMSYVPHLSAAAVEDAFLEADTAGTGRITLRDWRDFLARSASGMR